MDKNVQPDKLKKFRIKFQIIIKKDHYTSQQELCVEALMLHPSIEADEHSDWYQVNLFIQQNL